MHVSSFLAVILVGTSTAVLTAIGTTATTAEEREVRLPSIPSCAPLANITASEYYGLRNVNQLLLLKKRRVFELEGYIGQIKQPSKDPEDAAIWKTAR
jgi:hypothetical protein